MSELLKQLKAEQLSARQNKNKIKSSLFTTLIGEIETKTLRPSTILNDELVISTIKYFLKNINEALNLVGENIDLIQEKHYLEELLPKQMDSSELNTLIETIVNKEISLGNKVNLGLVMKLLAGYPNIDKKLASELIKNYL